MAITHDDIQRTFAEQRKLTTTAINNGLFQSYYENLGFDWEGIFGWTHEYVHDNLQGFEIDLSDQDISNVVALVMRAIAIGFMVRPNMRSEMSPNSDEQPNSD